ncbi:hypothetical protein, variant 2 [Aphanomyces astaci]|uniref:Uncharacterized protein n=1 Tax=Aphanomyces astaci TaxID=112090 RepID=W4FPH7_APHAT|nr:hypothetical protein, variant 2 [Aphanomyces astaci]ETV68729.1 hypothetical protein, variant 2 [Aphanomyces astaci]|eukprot:XP_009841683.1 hypothetical protein, variant 2 [Aphanomyces astaci]
MTIPELEAIDSALEARLAANHRMQSELEEMETRILEFLKETDIALFPAVEDVSCNCIPEHFVPPAALPQHLKRCHGIVTHEGEPSSTQFFYQQPPSVNTARQTTQVPPPTESIPFEPVADPNDHFVDVSFDDDAAGVTDMSTLDDDVAPSLVEPSKSDTNTVVSFKDAVLAIASTPHDLHAHCSSWTSIPAVFSRPDTSTLAASSPIIHTWATSWCYSKANSPNDSATQALVAYIVQLVEHPDYCHPDIMAGELGEFLGASTSVLGSILIYFFCVIDTLSSYVALCTGAMGGADCGTSNRPSLLPSYDDARLICKGTRVDSTDAAASPTKFSPCELEHSSTTARSAPYPGHSSRQPREEAEAAVISSQGWIEANVPHTGASASDR